MEDALFWLEIEIVISSKLQHIGDRSSVITVAGPSGNGYIIHVNLDRSTKEFVLSDDWAEDMIHHNLEGCRGVCKAEEHDGGFIESIARFECHFVFITFLNTYVIIPPTDIQFGVYMRAS